jgi:transposase
LGPGLTPTEVARKHAISSGQLYTWRQQMLGGQMTLLSHAPPDFAQVQMTPAPQPSEAPADKNSTPVTPRRPAGLIEIVLPSGVTLRLDAEVDAATLGRVLAALDRR